MPHCWSQCVFNDRNVFADTRVVPVPKASSVPFPLCAGHEDCDLNQFCATTCATGSCGNGRVPVGTRGNFCQPCNECTAGFLAISGTCSVCKVAGNSAPEHSQPKPAMHSSSLSTLTNTRPCVNVPWPAVYPLNSARVDKCLFCPRNPQRYVPWTLTVLKAVSAQATNSARSTTLGSASQTRAALATPVRVQRMKLKEC